jgi:Phage Coat protein B.
MKNWKQKLAVAATTAMMAATASAGKIAEAISGNQAVTDGTADLYTIGGVVVGFVVVGVVFGAGLKLFRKGG